MKILVTGGAGFIGSHLSDALLASGHRVVAYDDLSTGRRANVAHLESNPHFGLITADVRDRGVLKAAMAGIDVVVHLAARIGLKVIMESPLETIQVNASGTEAVLDCAAEFRIPAIVASTSEVYGASTIIPSSEDDPICFGSPTIGRWSYACTKAYDEFYALAMGRERSLPNVVVRLFNTVGPRQTGRYGMVIPRFVTQALQNEPLTVYGDGTQTRCFCSVRDVVGAFLTIVEDCPRYAGEVFNVGNPEEISIESLARRVIALTESSSTIEHVSFDRIYGDGFAEIMRRVPDIGKARRMLGFDPATALDDILRDVISSIRPSEQLV